MQGVSAIVLNWRTPELALRARDALVGDGLAPEQVMLIDNASGDGSVERLRAGAPGSPVLAMEDNVGFARANNQGARGLPAARAYLFVNSDAFVHVPGSVAALAQALRRPGVGIAVPRLRNPDGTLQPSVVPLSSPLPEIVRASGLSRWIPNRLQPELGTHWDHGGSRPIQAAIGAVLAVDASAWEAVGGFDERLFMYGEDHDLFRRLAACGYGAWFTGEAEFTHLGGASSARRWEQAERAERVARSEARGLVGAVGVRRARPTIAIMAIGVGVRGDRLRAAGTSKRRRRAARVVARLSLGATRRWRR